MSTNETGLGGALWAALQKSVAPQQGQKQAFALYSAYAIFDLLIQTKIIGETWIVVVELLYFIFLSFSFDFNFA